MTHASAKYPLPLSKKNKEIITAHYFEALRHCTQTVYDIYQSLSYIFPKEYLGLISSYNPNGTILRIPNKLNSGNMVGIKFLRVKKYGMQFTEEDLCDLSNTWVYLEEGQTPLKFLDLFFKFMIHHLGLTNYRIKQMYLDLELDEEDDFTKDPDYTPSSDEDDCSDELEYKSEISDGDDSPDYVPSVDSEDEYENTHRPVVVKPRKSHDSDGDDSPDYVPSVDSEDEYENTHRTIVVKKRPARKYYKTIS